MFMYLPPERMFEIYQIMRAHQIEYKGKLPVDFDFICLHQAYCVGMNQPELWFEFDKAYNNWRNQDDGN